jgi:hypothetical protein
MECPVCYTSQAKYKLVCGHSFCYQCITHWYQECGSHTCPVCRSDIEFETNEDTRELHIQCAPNSKIDDYSRFQDLLEKYRGCTKIKDVEYLRRQDWVEWVMEHRAKKQVYTKYIFHGLQGTEEACYKERQEEQEAGIFTKAYKD